MIKRTFSFFGLLSILPAALISIHNQYYSITHKLFITKLKSKINYTFCIIKSSERETESAHLNFRPTPFRGLFIIIIIIDLFVIIIIIIIIIIASPFQSWFIHFRPSNKVYGE
eukprot:gene9707-6803_t